MRITKAVASSLAAAAMLAAGAYAAAAQSSGNAEQQSQGKAAPATPRGFDYWQPDWMIRELWGPGRMPKSVMARLLRHTTYMQYGVPREYQDAKSTVKANPETIAAGGRLYAQHCASCHSADGMGNGDAARALSPSPALLGYMIKRPVAVDEYLLWTIADGGKQFNTEMPAFHDKLPRDDIWRIIAYMRAGFPQAGQPAAPAGGAKR
jgi:mono/diheme cytochrome c family protein